MAYAGSFCWHRGRGVHYLFLFSLPGSFGALGDSARAVLVGHRDLMGFPLHIIVCVFVLFGVFWELLIGMLG